MLVPERFQRFVTQCQFAGVIPTGQADGSDDASAVPHDMAAQVGKGTPLTDKIVYEHILSPFDDRPFKDRGTGKPLPSGGSGMVHDVYLNDRCFHLEAELFAQKLGKGRWNSIESLSLERVHRDQPGVFDLQASEFVQSAFSKQISG